MAELKIMERPMIVALAYVSGVVLAGILIGLWRYGIDLSAVFLGTHWNSPLQQTRGTIAIEGALVFVTLAFGGFFVFSVAALIRDSLDKRRRSQIKSE